MDQKDEESLGHNVRWVALPRYVLFYAVFKLRSKVSPLSHAGFLHQQGRSLRGASSNVWLVESSDEDNGVDGDDDEAVRYLPKSHDGAQTTSMHAPDGRRVCLQDSVDETEDQWTEPLSPLSKDLARGRRQRYVEIFEDGRGWMLNLVLPNCGSSALHTCF